MPSGKEIRWTSVVPFFTAQASQPHPGPDNCLRPTASHLFSTATLPVPRYSRASVPFSFISNHGGHRGASIQHSRREDCCPQQAEELQWQWLCRATTQAAPATSTSSSTNKSEKKRNCSSACKSGQRIPSTGSPYKASKRKWTSSATSTRYPDVNRQQ